MGPVEFNPEPFPPRRCNVQGGVAPIVACSASCQTERIACLATTEEVVLIPQPHWLSRNRQKHCRPLCLASLSEILVQPLSTSPFSTFACLPSHLLVSPSGTLGASCPTCQCLFWHFRVLPPPPPNASSGTFACLPLPSVSASFGTSECFRPSSQCLFWHAECFPPPPVRVSFSIDGCLNTRWVVPQVTLRLFLLLLEGQDLPGGMTPFPL